MRIDKTAFVLAFTLGLAACVGPAQADSRNNLKWYVAGVLTQMQMAGTCEVKPALGGLSRLTVADFVANSAVQAIAELEAKDPSISDTEGTRRFHIAVVGVLARDVCRATGEPA